MDKRRIRKALARIRQLPLNKHLFSYLINKQRHFYNTAIRSTRVAWPSNLMLELSAGCNLACTTCPREYEYGIKMDKGFMDDALARKIIDDAWPYLDSIGLTGMGETFLYPDLENLVHYIKAKNKGIIISLSTNAHVPDFGNRIIPLVNNVDTIQISADGVDDVYESIRKKASFAVFKENVKTIAGLCMGSKTDLMLNMVVTCENYQQMPLLIHFASENRIRYLDYTMFNLAAVSGFDSTYYDFYKSAEFLQVYSETLSVAANHPEVSISSDSFPFSRTGGFRNCPFPWSHFYITWQGYLVPCCAKPFPKEKNFGNVKDDSLINLLNNNDFRNFRKLWYRKITPQFCNNCHFITGSTS